MAKQGGSSSLLPIRRDGDDKYNTVLFERVPIMPQSMLLVESIPAFEDNYIWMLPTGNETWAAVDPGEAEPVIEYLHNQGASLSHILLTHHHQDHTAGVETLQQHYNPVVVGASCDQHRLPALTETVVDGQRLQMGRVEVEVMEVPGHTLGHVTYLADPFLFTGDTLFRFGCGRLFEGSPEQMWQSLLKIRALPDTTLLCAAHEYSLVNVTFSCGLEPNNRALQNMQEKIVQKIGMGKGTMPSQLLQEKRFNPFLRADDAAFAAAIGMADLNPLQVFTAIRNKRNHY